MHNIFMIVLLCINQFFCDNHVSQLYRFVTLYLFLLYLIAKLIVHQQRPINVVVT